MEDLIQSIIRLCKRLKEAGIPYVIGGSVASGLWGEPRQTNDVDVEIWVSSESAEVFLSAFDASYLVSRTELMEALESQRPFRSVQVLDSKDILKFDCFLQAFSEIDQEMFDHSVMLPFGGTEVRVACAEHILVQKLRWYDLGNRVSERQWRDIAGIIAVMPDLRWNLIERWATEYGVGSLVSEIKPEGN